MTSEPELAGQTVVVIGGSSGMGLETARLAGQRGAGVIIAGRHAGTLKQAAAEVGARETAAFDATGQAALAVHLMVNTAVTGATHDIDGGRQLVPGALRGARPAGRDHHRRLPGHRRRPGGRVPRTRLGGARHRPPHRAVASR
jgi:NADPH:quinone reductase-like Zn-dependent oxidoreductase